MIIIALYCKSAHKVILYIQQTSYVIIVLLHRHNDTHMHTHAHCTHMHTHALTY